ncbi:hypothetical protein B0H17DRAFT_1192381 [Mycena rosella]|uniref:Uncharacterized protein n=1 Tax=Mycena rosella TaxID=1033263 RepID=A0AAD7M9H8_MYCRO|nr:hypothetical protein B0H17DRAFT_1192381 [Mycena rosella]
MPALPEARCGTRPQTCGAAAKRVRRSPTAPLAPRARSPWRCPSSRRTDHTAVSCASSPSRTFVALALPTDRARIVAWRPTYRKSGGGQNLTKALLAMINALAVHRLRIRSYNRHPYVLGQTVSRYTHRLSPPAHHHAALPVYPPLTMLAELERSNTASVPRAPPPTSSRVSLEAHSAMALHRPHPLTSHKQFFVLETGHPGRRASWPLAAANAWDAIFSRKRESTPETWFRLL